MDAYPNQIFHGTVWQIREAPINVQNAITYDVVITVSNPDLKLFPGMTANATILTGHVSNALRIPKAALRFHPRPDSRQSPLSKQSSMQPQSAPTVYALARRGRLEAVQIKTGIGDANRVEVSGGNLVEGEEVVTGMAAKLGVSGAPSQGTGGTKKLGF